MVEDVLWYITASKMTEMDLGKRLGLIEIHIDSMESFSNSVMLLTLIVGLIQTQTPPQLTNFDRF